MAESTAIAWTDKTFNAVWGCVKVSPGCAHCYADTLASRYGHDIWGKNKPRRTFGPKHWQEPVKWNREAQELGRRFRVFCGSMFDWAEDHPTTIEEVRKLWPLIRATPYLDWQLLTKRHDRIATSLPSDWGQGYANVWLGVSIENNDYVHRADALRQIPATVRFISYEPALGPLDKLNLAGIDWVIYGGESGPDFRPEDKQWARDMKARCESAGTAFFHKQSGGTPHRNGYQARWSDRAQLSGPPAGAAAARHLVKRTQRQRTTMTDKNPPTPIAPEQPPLRAAREIQLAHDVLHGVIHDNLPIDIEDDHRLALQAVHDALCWVLLHENPSFANNLQLVMELASAAGFKLSDLAEPDRPVAFVTITARVGTNGVETECNAHAAETEAEMLGEMYGRAAATAYATGAQIIESLKGSQPIAAGYFARGFTRGFRTPPDHTTGGAMTQPAT